MEELKSRLDIIPLAQSKSELKNIITQVEGSLNEFKVVNESSSIENRVALATLQQWEKPQPQAARAQGEVKKLIQDMNSSDRSTRLSATGILSSQFSDNPEAVKLVLEFYNPNKIDSLSAQGRINALHFLTNTTQGAWDSDTINKAEKLIEQHNQQIQFLRTQLQNVEMTLQQISENVQRTYS